MKIIKYLFLLLLIVVIGALIYIATLNGHFRVEKTITLKAPQSLIFQEANNLKNWENWAFPPKERTKANFSYSQKTTGEGAYVEWKSDSLANGKILTKTAVHNSTLKQKATIENRFGQTNQEILWHFTPENDTTRVQLQIKGGLSFWAKAYQVLQDTTTQERLNARVEQSLQRLKKQVLKKMAVYSINVDGVAKATSRNYIYTSQASKNKPEVVAKKRRKALEDLRAFLQKNKLAQSGPAFMIFNTIDRKHGNVILSFALPVEGEINLDPNSSILFGTLPGQRVVKSTLTGNYDNIGKLWQVTKAYMQKNDLEETENAQPYEVFVKGRDQSENPADWVTQLFVPVQSKKVEKNDPLGF